MGTGTTHEPPHRAAEVPKSARQVADALGAATARLETPGHADAAALVAALDQMWYLGGTSTQQWDFLLSKALRGQRQWFSTRMAELASADLEAKQKELEAKERESVILRREVLRLQTELARSSAEARKEKMAGAFRTGVLGLMVKAKAEGAEQQEEAAAGDLNGYLDYFGRLDEPEQQSNLRVLLESMSKPHQVPALISLGETLAEYERARLVQTLIPSIPPSSHGPTLHALTKAAGQEGARALDEHMACTIRELGARGGAAAVVSICQGLTGTQRAKVLVELATAMGPHEQKALTASRLQRCEEAAAQTEPYHPLANLAGMGVEERRAALAELHRHSAGVEGETCAELFAMMGHPERKQMARHLRAMGEQLQVKVDDLKELCRRSIGMQGAGGKGALAVAAKKFAETASDLTPSKAAAPAGKPKLSRHKTAAISRRGVLLGGHKAVVAPEHRHDVVCHLIGELWADKIVDDAVKDKRNRPRLPMTKFLREAFLRKHGFRNVANKAFNDLASSARYFSESAEEGAYTSRARLFHQSLGLAGGGDKWTDHKVDFFMGLVSKVFTLHGSDERSSEAAARQGPPHHHHHHTHHTHHHHHHRADDGRGGGAGLGDADFTKVAESTPLREHLARLKDGRGHHDVEKAAVRRLMERIVRDEPTRNRVLDALEANLGAHDVEVFGGRHVMCWEAGQVVELVMDEWQAAADAMQETLERRILTAFTDYDANGNMLLSYGEFEELLRQLAPQHADNALDLYDEALQYSDDADGMEVESVTPEAWKMVVLKHGIMTVDPRAAPFVDPLALVTEARKKKAAAGRAGAAGGPKYKAAAGAGARRNSRDASPAAKRKGGERGKGPKTAKDAYVYELVETAVRSNFLFRSVPPERLKEIVGYMQRFEFEAGQVVMTQGDKGDYFYVLESGVYDVHVTQADASTMMVHTYQTTEALRYPCFGELALMYAKPRAATVRCSQAGVLWGLDRAGFRTVQTSADVVDVTHVLRRVEVLSSLRFDQLQQIRDMMVDQEFAEGTQVVVEGDAAETFFVLLRGSISVRRRKAQGGGGGGGGGGEGEGEGGGGGGGGGGPGADDDTGDEVTVLEENRHFGERALLPNKAYMASCVAMSDIKCATISRSAFEGVLGPLQPLLEQDQLRRQAELEARRQMLEAQGLHSANLRSFGLEAVAHRLPSGGALLLATHHTTRKAYTLRLESKRELTKRARADPGSHAVEALAAELACLKQAWDLDHARARESGGAGALPGLLHLFQTDGLVCLLLNARVVGALGELAHLWSWGAPRKDGMGLTELIWCVACLASALERLHAQRLLLRTIAAPRLLLDEAGYVRVLDLGHAKHLNDDGVHRTHTLCGPPEYMSPEEVGGEGHSFARDWWALGVLLAQLDACALPFGDASWPGGELALYKRIHEHAAGGALPEPPQTPRHAAAAPSRRPEHAPTVQLRTALLHPDPAERLGGKGGAAEVMAHEWFDKKAPDRAKINWAALASGEAASPLRPKLALHAAELLRDGEAAAHQLADQLDDDAAGAMVRELQLEFDAVSRHMSG